MSQRSRGRLPILHHRKRECEGFRKRGYLKKGDIEIAWLTHRYRRVHLQNTGGPLLSFGVIIAVGVEHAETWNFAVPQESATSPVLTCFRRIEASNPLEEAGRPPGSICG